MDAPRSTYHPGQATQVRIAPGGVPISVSFPAFLLVLFATLGLSIAAQAFGWPRPQLFLLSALPLYVLVWAVERHDEAIFWLLGSWVVLVLAGLVGDVFSGRLRVLRAASRDPWGE